MEKKAVRSLIIIFCLSLFIVILNKPIYNFDAIGYAGSVVSKDKVYQDAEKFLPANEFYKITHNHPTGRLDLVYQDQDVFNAWLPLYRIRVGFTALVFLLNKAGMNSVRAVHFLSAFFSCLGLGLALFLFGNRFAFLLIIGALGFGWLELARLPVVDGMVFTIMILVGYLYMKKNKAALFLLPLLIAIRIDMIIFVAIVYISSMKKEWKRELLISAILSCAVYLAIYYGAGAYSYRKVFYFSLIEKNPRMDLLENFSIDYFAVAFEKFQNIPKTLPLMFYIFLSLINLSTYQRTMLERLAVMGNIYTIIHLVIFPAVYSRYFFAFYVLTLIVFLKWLKEEKYYLITNIR